jgi:hypothetical protein
VLKLSTIWGFHAVRDQAIARLSSLAVEPIEKIILAKQYRVVQWLVPHLNALAQRDKPLSLDEGKRVASVLGWALVMKIAEVRESSLYGLQANVSICACGMTPTGIRQSQYCSSHNVHYSAGYSTGGNLRASHDFCPAIKTAFGGDIDIDAYDASQTVAEPSLPVGEEGRRVTMGKKKKVKK